MKMWFDDADSETARAHKAAYEKSVKEQRCVKVHVGCYYYKGYEVSNDGGTEYPWNYGRPSEISHEGSAETKALAVQYIDSLLRGEK